MAFKTKSDYCGLATVFDTELGIRSDAKNESKSTYAPVGEDGSVLALESYGSDASPANSYAIKAAITATAGELKLGKLTTVGTEKFILKSVTFSTSVNSPVAVTANAELVESAATETAADLYSVPAFNVATTHKAQDIFSAFTYTNGNLTACNTNIECSVGKDTLVGDIITNKFSEGKITVSGTLLCTPDSTPTLTAATGWVITKPLTCDNPETAYPTYTFELQKALARVGTSAS